MKLLASLIALVAALLLSTPVHAQTANLKASDSVTVELKVPAEDSPNVSSVYQISNRGTIKLPYLTGEIQAAGMSTTELARRIEAAYRSAEIYTNPTINANIAANTAAMGAAHVVAVGGEVRSPQGSVPLRDGMRLYQAIMHCGGPSEFADMRKVKVIRGTREFRFDMRHISPDGSNNPVLQDGDTIHIPAD